MSTATSSNQCRLCQPHSTKIRPGWCDFGASGDKGRALWSSAEVTRLREDECLAESMPLASASVRCRGGVASVDEGGQWHPAAIIGKEKVRSWPLDYYRIRG